MTDRPVFVTDDDDIVWVGIDAPRRTISLPLSPIEAEHLLALLLKWKEGRS